jgi:hypothetical protein
MEAMLNERILDASVSNGVWDKICLVFPILSSNVRVFYMSAE